MTILVRMPDGTSASARVMGAWRPLVDRSTRVRLEWCLAAAEGNIVLVAVRPRGGSRVVGAVANAATAVAEDDAHAVVEAHGGAAKLADDAPLGWQLHGLGFLRADDLSSFLSMQYRVPTIDLEAYEIDPDVIALVSRELCAAHTVLPVSRAGGSLIVAMIDPSDGVARDALAAATGFAIEPVIAQASELRAAIARYYAK